MKKFRTTTELEVGKKIEAIFTKCQDSIEIKLERIGFLKLLKCQTIPELMFTPVIFKTLIISN